MLVDFSFFFCYIYFKGRVLNMVCQNCGNNLSENEKKCSKCGMNIKSNLNNYMNNDKAKTNNRKTLSIAIAIVILVIISGVFGDLLIKNTSPSNVLLGKLKEKYNEEFQIGLSGGRDFLNTSKTYYVHPKNNPNIIFSAQISHDKLSDNYVDNVMYYEAEKKIEDGLKEKGIEAVSTAVITDFHTFRSFTENDIKRNSKMVTYNEFKEQYSFDDFYIKVAINKEDISDNQEDIKQVFVDASKELDKNIVGSLYTFNSSNYQKEKEMFYEYESPSDDEIKNYSNIKHYSIVIENNICRDFYENDY